MVNYGRSSGCLRCRQRKLKCDESQPSCQRCNKIGKDCPGYRDEWDLAFRNETVKIESRFHVKQAKDSRDSSPSALPRSLPSHDTQIAVDIDSSQSTIYTFFQDYVVAPCSHMGNTGWLSFLPKLYEAAPSSPILQSALSAVAYANLAQKTQRLDLSIKAISYYHISLERVNSALLDSLVATSDITMASVLLLGIYESINCTFPSSIKYIHHSQGLKALAGLRGSLMMKGSGRDMLETICCQMQKRNIDLKLAPNATDEWLISTLDPTLVCGQVSTNMFHVANFITNPRNEDWEQRYQELEQRFCQWEEAGLVRLRLQMRHSTPRELQSGEAQCGEYPSVWSVSAWNQHRATRIIFHQAVLEKLDAANSHNMGGPHRTASLSIIDKMIQDMFASIPFCLGDTASSYDPIPKSASGYFLVWDLKAVIQCSYVSAEQQRQARTFLQRIGEQFGISSAFAVAETLCTSAIKLHDV